MVEKKEINDLIVLGRAAPEPMNEDGRHTVCLGGYSEDHGFIRLYPTKMEMKQCTRWNVVSVPVEHDDSHDPRDESYKIQGSKKDWDKLHKKVEKTGRIEDKEERIKLINKLADDCPAKLNKQKKSLGIVDPEKILDVYLESQGDSPIQMDLVGKELKGKNDYPYKLYIKYRCENCVQKTPHDQHCIEWGMYRYWDKNDDYEGVIDALRVNDEEYKKYFFVGNLRHHPTSFIVISVLRFKKEEWMRKYGIEVGDQSSVDEWV
ncbi:MAG: hypothetical protein U5J64_02720 [Halobacteriales archaeon]|nr:hypothetical protein [Halobacteriales archaeon]